ncbi:MAG TPA: hypothetical protein ENJ95_13070 [Bacteroidetes bacterium]|nr:hypothetical protein [Bacteroidota bacterium]
MKKCTLVTSFLLIGFSLFAQKFTLFNNPLKWDENRYSDIKGSPFFFKDFVEGTIHGIGGEVYDKVKLNLNGYTHNIEVRRRDEYIELQEGAYDMVEVTLAGKNGDTTKTVFVTTQIGQFDGRFVQLIYDGEKRKVFNDFLVTISEYKTETPGKTLHVKRFAPKARYFLLEDGELSIFKLKKKNIVQYLGHKKEIETFLKKNKIKIDSAEGVAKVLEFAEGLE